jgi:hypothetical protein
MQKSALGPIRGPGWYESIKNDPRLGCEKRHISTTLLIKSILYNIHLCERKPYKRVGT